MPDFTSFTRLEIHFDTNILPAPFSHKYKITVLAGGQDSRQIELELEYYGREELSEEEIADEGFTDNDSFRWKGNLPQAWYDALIAKIRSSNWKKSGTAQQGDVLFLKVQQSSGATILWPADTRQWTVFAQELIQAIFELGSKEAPLQIQFMVKDSSKSSVLFEFVFSERRVNIMTSQGEHRKLDWEEGQKLLKYIFSLDYTPEDGLVQPKNPGYYISPGDTMWYSLGNNKITGDADKGLRLVETLRNYLD